MKTLRFFLLIIFLFPYSNTFAQISQPGFMTPRDLLSNNTVSNLNLKNNSNTSKTVYGLYVRQYAYVAQGSNCNSSTVIYATTQNTTAGSIVMPVVINSGKSTAVGSNFLYNMIYGAIYYENIIIPSSPPGCALPGCTWGSDTTKYNWCIFLGALSPVSNTASYTANVPPSMDSASSTGNYNYNLVTSYVTLGPISCDDQTLTCTVASQQTQSFS